jgi:hypothetical protein
MKRISHLSASRGHEVGRNTAIWDRARPASATPAPLCDQDDTRLAANRCPAPGATWPGHARDTGADELTRLYAALGQIVPANNPRTFKLLQSDAR